MGLLGVLLKYQYVVLTTNLAVTKHYDYCRHQTSIQHSFHLSTKAKLLFSLDVIYSRLQHSEKFVTNL